MTLSQCLTDASACPQFIVSKIIRDIKGHTNKIPCNLSGIISDHKNPKNWVGLEGAYSLIEKLGPEYRIGFSITKESKRFFIDIDKALVNGEWSQLAKDICKIFARCFIEVSQSGTGLHIMGKYTGELKHKNKNTALGIELYTHDRFILFGDIFPQGDWNTDASEALNSFITQYFDKDSPMPAALNNEESISGLSDEEVLEKAKNFKGGKEVFGNGASFLDLFECNEDVLARAYRPLSDGKLYDASAADQALANMLATHTQDIPQIIRLMWRSKLARDKWTTNKAYLLNTVSKAVSSRHAVPLSPSQSNKNEEESQAGLLTMPQEFDGCFYIKAEREIYSTTHGLLNQDGFNLCFGGPYLTETPYKTFKKHAALSGRVIGRLGFRPDLPHGEITENEEVTAINTYRPIKVKMQAGDMAPFFRFFDAMIPNVRDQQILLTYAAVLAQKPGVKSQWSLVLQGVQGCGKSLFADFVAYACGETYTHRAKGDEFENRFNDQWFGKTLILIEDPRLKEARLEDVLKPLITSRTLAFEGKGKRVQMNDFPANFILTLNDFDLLQKRPETRRLAVFMSALQAPEDLINAGLTPAEYRKIIDWRDSVGYQIFAHFIHNYVPIREFDYSGICVTAPETSTTGAAIEASRPEVEVTILNEVEQGRSGFKDGWISSTALTDFLVQQRLRYLMPDRKRGQILEGLGYIPHPYLLAGRSTRKVLPDNSRPVLFIKKGHPALNIIDRDAITTAYEEAQKLP